MNNASTYLDLIRKISERPQPYATTPEAAHGLVEGIAWIALHEGAGKPLEECTKIRCGLTK